MFSDLLMELTSWCRSSSAQLFSAAQQSQVCCAIDSSSIPVIYHVENRSARFTTRKRSLEIKIEHEPISAVVPDSGLVCCILLNLYSVYSETSDPVPKKNQTLDFLPDTMRRFGIRKSPVLGYCFYCYWYALGVWQTWLWRWILCYQQLCGFSLLCCCYLSRHLPVIEVLLFRSNLGGALFIACTIRY